ncbi:tail fiber assembly protein, partial [Salmonella enterica subsp. enterica serovar Weslaco]|nr:tail fiber assembly protein [Salmonella enterica subsp. enterica serovar Weslaco]
MKAYFIPSAPTFIPEEWKNDGTYTDNNWPKGKILGAIGGKPSWVDIPPPTKEELVKFAESERQRRIDAANDFMNSKQWPGKAAIGRLKDDDLLQYNLWLDYLDTLEAVDTSSATDIEWPDK